MFLHDSLKFLGSTNARIKPEMLAHFRLLIFSIAVFLHIPFLFYCDLIILISEFSFGKHREDL